MTENARPTWWVESFEGKVFQGCGTCASVERIAPLDTAICVGLGVANVSKDSRLVYQESLSDDEVHRLSEFEAIASEDPDHDWRAMLFAPL